MFKKKPIIKTLAPLRSSDRRKITDQIISEYQLEIPKEDVDSNDTNEQTNASIGIGALRNLLLPDGSLWAKFSTTVGADSKTVQGTVYVGTFLGEEQRILWFKVDERTYPTVYSLWKHPKLLPLLHTPDIVLGKMRGGADLMTPGLARGPPFPERAIKDSIVAVASLEVPSVPLVVGTCEIDVCALAEVQGVKGHAVRSLHWKGDELWAWSQLGKSGAPAPVHIKGWDDKDQEASSNLPESVADLTLSDPNIEQEVPAVDVEQPLKRHMDDHKNYSDGEDDQPFEEVSIEHKETSTKEIDAAFRHAFLFAMHSQRSRYPNNSRHGLDFPIPQSLLISSHVLPFLPIFNADDVATLQIKKTSWKTAKKFVKALEKDGLLRAKDRNGGETVIQEVDFEAAAITNFVPYGLPKKESTGAAGRGEGGDKAGSLSTTSNDDSIGQRLNKITLLKPKEKLAPIFEAANASVKSLYLPTELRPIITGYIEIENLVSETNKRLVNLNPVLANAVFDGESSLDREVLAKGSVPRDALIDRILQNCTPHWAILRNDETRETAKPKAGNAPTIKIILETRSGNKTVTKVSGIETFLINPQPLADELQKACASSTSVAQLVGSSPKNPVMEIMVQGPQKDVITKALEKRGVHRNWIEVMDKTKGKKR